MSPHWITKDSSSVWLAPMEGVTDYVTRTVLSKFTYFSHFVTEFLRVSGQIPSIKSVVRHFPEIKQASCTEEGLPISLQLLGGNADRLAATALNCVEAGARAIDLNFGCPAPTVNRHDGGATLLLHPDRLYEIVKTVRERVPASVPVSAKIRLGFSNTNDVHKNAEMIFKAGASWLTIHARTRDQGYRPPVDWKLIGEINANSPIPIIANGDIWTFDDFKKCRDLTQCSHYMLGRGIFVNPYLSVQIANELNLDTRSHRESIYPTPEVWRSLFAQLIEKGISHRDQRDFAHIRIKQWLGMRNKRVPAQSFEILKKISSADEYFAAAQNLELFALPNATHLDNQVKDF